jgi:hypothetical protein
MRAIYEAGANGVWTPRVLPLLGETIELVGVVVDRPGMVLEPRIGVADPSLNDGRWVEIRCTRLLTMTTFIERCLLPGFAL